MVSKATRRIYLAVAGGAALGSSARYLASLGMLAWLGAGFAWGTLLVNVLGSLLIGLYATMTEPDGRLNHPPVIRQFVLVGFCGGFTTFSIFSLETLLFLERGAVALAGLNVAGSPLLWLAAVWIGHRIGLRVNHLKGS